MAEVDIDEAKTILSENPAKVYGYDLETLQPIADRVCPTPRELVGTDGATTVLKDSVPVLAGSSSTPRLPPCIPELTSAMLTRHRECEVQPERLCDGRERTLPLFRA